MNNERNERCEGMCLDLDLEAGTNTVFVLSTISCTNSTPSSHIRDMDEIILHKLNTKCAVYK